MAIENTSLTEWRRPAEGAAGSDDEIRWTLVRFNDTWRGYCRWQQRKV